MDILGEHNLEISYYNLDYFFCILVFQYFEANIFNWIYKHFIVHPFLEDLTTTAIV